MLFQECVKTLFLSSSVFIPSRPNTALVQKSVHIAVAVHDVLIIRAGPMGLAVAARLREPTPFLVFTGAEHDRYQWIKKLFRGNPTSFHQDPINIKVLDNSGPNCLNSWRNNFEALDCPHELDGLLAYAHGISRSDNCVKIPTCIHGSINEHRRKRKRRRVKA